LLRGWSLAATFVVGDRVFLLEQILHEVILVLLFDEFQELTAVRHILLARELEAGVYDIIDEALLGPRHQRLLDQGPQFDVHLLLERLSRSTIGSPCVLLVSFLDL
jgi:hypothetical protein